MTEISKKRQHSTEPDTLNLTQTLRRLTVPDPVSEDLPEDVARRLGLQRARGLIVAAVDRDGPAARTGIEQWATLLGVGARQLADAGAREGRPVVIETEIVEVCQKKGCFFIAQDGDSVARITFVDYSFFVPTDSGGKTVTIVGTFDRKTLSEAQARHYAEDAGGDPSKVVGPRSEYAIVATSVIVPKS